jgi:S1-C subfamily serine protease
VVSAWRLASTRARSRAEVTDADGPGAYVGGVRESSPAERAGVQVGDVVIELSGLPVSSVADLEQIATRRVPGQPTSLIVKRDGAHATLIVR